jgi:hypothetical protein
VNSGRRRRKESEERDRVRRKRRKINASFTPGRGCSYERGAVDINGMEWAVSWQEKVPIPYLKTSSPDFRFCRAHPSRLGHFERVSGLVSSIMYNHPLLTIF